MGHFLNKVLKDTINRWQMLKGRRVHYQPGWDCHGLPIEIRALQQAATAAASAGDGAAPPSLAEEPLLLREAAAACAREAMAGQLVSFERWGVMGAWDAPYTTMQPAYEAAELGVLRSLLRRGLIYRGRRPVHWSPATRTALAEAELEYPEGHTSVAAYIGFGLLPPAPPPRSDAAAASQAATATTALPADVAAAMGAAGGVLVPIWTTTPWTIPSNKAVVYGEEISYGLYEVTETPGECWARVGERYILADKLAAQTFARARLEEGHWRRVSDVTPHQLAAMTLQHPLAGAEGSEGEWDDPRDFRAADFVTDEEGTGFVHCAPSHGMEEFELYRELGMLDQVITYNVMEDGSFREGLPFFGGRSILKPNGKEGDANKAVIDKLVEVDRASRNN
mgnify:CR=1 FL=1